MPPSTPGTRWLRSRTLAKVPRTITSWLPRRAPYELKSFGSMPLLHQVLSGRDVLARCCPPARCGRSSPSRPAPRSRARRDVAPAGPAAAASRRSRAASSRTRTADPTRIARSPGPSSFAQLSSPRNDVRVARFEHRIVDARARLSRRSRRCSARCLCRKTGLPVAPDAERLAREVDVHASGQRIGDDERRRGEVVGAHLRMDAPFEVAVTGKHRRDDQVAGRRPSRRRPAEAGRSFRCRSCSRSRRG